MSGKVVSIALAPEEGAPTVNVPEVRAVVGRGLEGDRKSKRRNPAESPGGDVTLIEVEALEALARDYRLALEPKDSRRNVAVRDIALNHLVGREFDVGEVRLRGIKLCEPCDYLEKITGKSVRAGLVHRGGLRAQVVAGGTIRVGDPVVLLPAAARA
jgi:MOSC domain-containing protein YiiM